MRATQSHRAERHHLIRDALVWAVHDQPGGRESWSYTSHSSGQILCPRICLFESMLGWIRSVASTCLSCDTPFSHSRRFCSGRRTQGVLPCQTWQIAYSLLSIGLHAYILDLGAVKSWMQRACDANLFSACYSLLLSANRQAATVPLRCNFSDPPLLIMNSYPSQPLILIINLVCNHVLGRVDHLLRRPLHWLRG